jgi:hypothetical protein
MRTGLLLLCGSVLLIAQGIEPAQLKADLGILRAALEEGHPGIYRYTSKPELDAVFQQAEVRLDHPMSALEFYRIVSPAVAALKCGHTALMISADLQTRLRESLPLIPVDVRVLNGKLFVFRDCSEGARLAGAEILSINGKSSGQILRTMLASIHGDGGTLTAGPWRIGAGHQFAPALYTLLGIESPFRVEYRLDGNATTATLVGMPQKQLLDVAYSRYPQDRPPSASATYRFNEKTGVAVLTIHQFGGTSEDGKPLSQFFQKVYDDIHERHGSNLIIDVRGNGGGADELGKQLFSYLVAKPFPYYDDLVINKLSFDFFRYVDKPHPIAEDSVEKRPNGKYLLKSHPNWGLQQPGTPRFDGRVFALMNGGSFSTTCEFLSTLHHHHRAVFVGEEAAGGYYGNTSGPGAMLVLPNSKLRLPIRLMTYYMAIPGSEYGDRSIPPDYRETYSMEELLAGKDKEMDLALSIISDGSKR